MPHIHLTILISVSQCRSKWRLSH